MLEKIEKLRRLILKLMLDEEDYGEFSDTLDDLESTYDDLKENSILDLDKFKRELETQNLMNNKLREFIDRYMQFDNHE